MPAPGDAWIAVGEVVGLHGLRGDLKVRPRTPGSEVLLDATRVRLDGDRQDPLESELLRVSAHKGNWLLRLPGVASPEAAQALIGRRVSMLRGEFAEPEHDEHYWDELEGLEVIDRRLGPLGRVEELFSTAAHDIYVVRGPHGEILIPAVAALVSEIDPEGGRILVDLPDGLVETAP